MSTRLHGLAVAFAMVLVGCGLVGGGAEIDGSWTFQDGTRDGAPITTIAEAPVTLTIEGSEVGGIAACNHYGGTLERTGSQIVISALSMTEMGCDEPTMALESAYLAALAEVNLATRVGDRLTLTGPGLQLDFTLVPPEADAPLTQTPWILDSMVSGDAVASVIGDGSIAFSDDGTLTGSTGCRGFGGTFEMDGSTLHIGQLVTDDRACTDELAAQDADVLELLESSPTFSIGGRRLSLRAGDRGLDYVVAES